MKDIVIRQATSEDVETIFYWRNLKEIVGLSQSQRTVTWEEHTQWFNDALSFERNSIYIIVADGDEVGLIRFERKDQLMDLTIYLESDNIGKGIGSVAIEKAMALEESSCNGFFARVREDNARSKRFFEKHSFKKVRQEDGVWVYQKLNKGIAF